MPEEQPTQPPVYNLPGMHITDSILKEQIDATKILKMVENTILGKTPTYNEKTERWELSKPDPKMQMLNEKGCNFIKVQLRPRISKIFQLSALNEEKIEALALSFGQVLRENLFFNWEEWGLKRTDIATASGVTRLCVAVYLATLYKAHEGKYLRYLGNVLEAKSNETPQQVMPGYSPQQLEKPNVIKRFFGRG